MRGVVAGGIVALLSVLAAFYYYWFAMIPQSLESFTVFSAYWPSLECQYVSRDFDIQKRVTMYVQDKTFRLSGVVNKSGREWTEHWIGSASGERITWLDGETACTRIPVDAIFDESWLPAAYTISCVRRFNIDPALFSTAHCTSIVDR